MAEHGASHQVESGDPGEDGGHEAECSALEPPARLTGRRPGELGDRLVQAPGHRGEEERHRDPLQRPHPPRVPAGFLEGEDGQDQGDAELRPRDGVPRVDEHQPGAEVWPVGTGLTIVSCTPWVIASPQRTTATATVAQMVRRSRARGRSRSR